mgnify:FL=1
MKSIKINHIESASLSKAEMAHTKGGNVCNCSCYYRNVGGSSIEDNGHANWTGNKNSVEKTADAALMIDDGNGGCRDFWTS